MEVERKPPRGRAETPGLNLIYISAVDGRRAPHPSTEAGEGAFITRSAHLAAPSHDERGRVGRSRISEVCQDCRRTLILRYHSEGQIHQNDPCLGDAGYRVYSLFAASRTHLITRFNVGRYWSEGCSGPYSLPCYGTYWDTYVLQFASSVLGPPEIYSLTIQMLPSEPTVAVE